MKAIQEKIFRACDAIDDAYLHVGFNEDVWIASIVDVDGEPITCEANHEMLLVGEGDSAEAAVAALEALCASDTAAAGDLEID